MFSLFGLFTFSAIARCRYFFASLLLLLGGCTDAPKSPDFVEQPWHSLSASFCTMGSDIEVWKTTDTEKLRLLQGALTVESPELLDHIVKSRNHGIEIELATEQGVERWHLVLNRDQAHVSYFQIGNPSRSFKAASDAMFYRALNTLLKSHMNESLDIFRQCEMPE